MKTIKIMKRLMGCAAAILALTACSESEDLLAAYHSDSKAVHITAQVGKASADGFTRSNPLGATEADQAKFNENDEISVRADGQDAVTYKLKGSEWEPQGGKFLKWEKETMNFTAYYPASFDGNITQPTEYTSPESLAAADFMSFTGNVTNSGNNSLTLTMERKMARVVVEIAGFNDQYAGATVNSINSLNICGIKAYKHSDKKFYALIKPCDAQNSETFLSLDVAEGESKTTTEKFTGIPKLEAGNSYTYKLTVGKNKVKVNGVTVADWTEGKIIPDDDKAKYTPYVTFTANGEQTFQMAVVTNKYGSYTFPNLEYSVNNGEWAAVKAGTEITFGGAHGDLRLRGTNNTQGTSSPYVNNNSFDHSEIQFSTKNEVACKGDIRILLDYKNYKTVNTDNARFYKLFAECKQLISAPELPATTLADNCYSAMFVRCSSLISAPKLPATTLANNCYCDMFNGCTNLTSAPELPATTLAADCYIHMFEDCTKLSTVTMLAPSDEIANKYDACFRWLYDAGTDASVSSRILKVQNAAAYKALVDKGYLPEIWTKSDRKTIVVDKNNEIINIE